MIGRGEQMKVRVAIEQTVDHELSGNIIDLCPVGALDSKPFRFRARAWEMTSHPLVSPHDGVGTNLFGHVLRGRLMRVVPRENEAINETWIADRDRFSYEGIYSADRLEAPHGARGQASGKRSTGQRRSRRRRKACGRARRVSACSRAARARSKSCICWVGITRGLGSNNIDHRLRQADFRDQACGSGVSVAGHADRRHRASSMRCCSSGPTCAARCRCSRIACARRRSAARRSRS